eukprot:m.93604 g.93604  ORF g.93604 m.93604 type:complete len:181 (-) comp14707_c4_seq1:57-599(-)
MSSRPTLLSRMQGPVQAILRPGQWCFGVRSIRQGTEHWIVAASMQTLVDAVKTAVQEYQHGQQPEDGLVNTLKVRVTKARVESTTAFVRIENYTQTAEWLDVLELHIKQVEGDPNSCNVYAKSFSSGVCPTCIPCAPLLNIALCWIPFADMSDKGSLNSLRIAHLREKLSHSVTIQFHTA